MDGPALIAIGIIVLSVGVALAAGFQPGRATMTTARDRDERGEREGTER